MINTILKVVDIKQGKIKPNKTLFSPRESIAPIVQRYEGIAQKEVVVNCAEIEIYADRQIFETVFTNLYSNAIKHAKTKILVTLEETKDNYILSVEDDGEGIPQQNRTSVFDMFEQIGNSDVLNRGQQSLGLGLYIVKQLTKLCAKEIKIETSPTLGGAAFIINGEKS